MSSIFRSSRVAVDADGSGRITDSVRSDPSNDSIPKVLIETLPNSSVQSLIVLLLSKAALVDLLQSLQLLNILQKVLDPLYSLLVLLLLPPLPKLRLLPILLDLERTEQLVWEERWWRRLLVLWWRD